MTRQQALARLMSDVQSDIADYHALRQALSQQFDSAMQHNSAKLAELAERITEIVDTLERRRLARLSLTHILTGEAQPRNIQGVLEQLSSKSRTAFEGLWRELEALVRECKSMNARNCAFIVEQNALMQRVLHGEENTYVAP